MSDAEVLDCASEELVGCSNVDAAIKVIAAKAGGLAQQVAASRSEDLPSRWGLSTVIDNNTGTPIIGEPVFDALHTIADVRARFPIGNAGLVHVYGYLLSREPTPYGLKRERWLEPQTALALGLDSHAFAPRLLDASATPLLGRVTDALEPLVSRESERGVLVGQDDVLARPTGPPITMRSMIVGASGRHAAILGVVEEGEVRLVTVFPVGHDAVKPMAQELAFGPVSLRWNVVLRDAPTWEVTARETWRMGL